MHDSAQLEQPVGQNNDFDNLAKSEPAEVQPDKLRVLILTDHKQPFVSDYHAYVRRVFEERQTTVTLHPSDIAHVRKLLGYSQIENATTDYYRTLPDGTKEGVTRSEYKQHMRKHFTVQHQRCQPCGHKFVPEQEPRHRHCESCWFTYFTVYGQVTNTADEVFKAHGEAGLVQLRGRNFTNNFLKYMSTLAQWKAAADAAKAAEEQSTEVTDEQAVDTCGVVGA